jgi:signal transduction histidine kinase
MLTAAVCKAPGQLFFCLKIKPVPSGMPGIHALEGCRHINMGWESCCMKLSTKLVISFFVIVFMPILLAALAFLCIRLIQMKAVANQSTIDIGMLAYQIDTSQLGVLVEDMAVCIVLILVVTGLSITAWIYRGIVTPIYKLEEAAQNIKEGNLDFTVEAETNDEMGKLCRNFEDMRQRLKESAEEKLEAEKQNRILISNISHDLKTPITAIKGYVEGIMDGVADTPEKVDKYMRTIYSKAIDMDRLINELTLYAKIDTNRIPYDFKRMKASDYFDDCIEEIGLGLEAEHIGLSYFNYAEDSVEIIADPEQLKRVIDNIIGNSIKYMDKEHGLINIRVKDVGDFIQIEIEDNGKGIAQKDLPFIFDRFYRTDASRNSATGGSGIGLSIVRKIVEDHGGKIWAASKESTGTVMYFVVRKYQEVPNE